MLEEDLTSFYYSLELSVVKKTLVVHHGELKRVVKLPPSKRRKYEEIKEIVFIFEDNVTRKNELICEINLLDEKIKEYKMFQLEDVKY